MIQYRRGTGRRPVPRTTLPTALVVAAAALAGCGSEPSGAGEGATIAENVQAGAIAASGIGGLCCGTRETLVDGITSAENVMFSADRRLFVSGDDGVYEIVRDASGQASATAVTPAAPEGGCKFAGLAQIGHTLYANCYTLSNSYLYAGSLTAPVQLESIYEMPGILLANGLAADFEGRLYVAATINGVLLRLHLSPMDPMKVTSQETWLANSGLLTDGLKFSAAGIDWSNGGAIERASIRPDGSPGPTITIVNQPTFFDDFYVDGPRILAADYLTGQVKVFVLGVQIDATPAVFTNPSAVVPALGRLGLGAADLVVTEKGANRLAVYHAR